MRAESKPSLIKAAALGPLNRRVSPPSNPLRSCEMFNSSQPDVRNPCPIRAKRKVPRAANGHTRLMDRCFKNSNNAPVSVIFGSRRSRPSRRGTIPDLITPSLDPARRNPAGTVGAIAIRLRPGRSGLDEVEELLLRPASCMSLVMRSPSWDTTIPFHANEGMPATRAGNPGVPGQRRSLNHRDRLGEGFPLGRRAWMFRTLLPEL